MQGIGQGVRVTSGNEGAGFGAMVKKATENAMETLRGGEKASANAVIGTADLTDVVEAVTNAELTLQTVVAVRDRMLNAYQDIMRMPI
ncbi:MAG: flagellar hook-basal body complex protein FliE [Alphaproteobacteria bacterium CG_4_9_14_3_um_filter_47_13]|nr:MAG: flagellar hook-basal body complex protein FliE [Alphaproteobacteria bacterium CG_4_9_14_3_um_filter_47_13]